MTKSPTVEGGVTLKRIIPIRSLKLGSLSLDSRRDSKKEALGIAVGTSYTNELVEGRINRQLCKRWRTRSGPTFM